MTVITVLSYSLTACSAVCSLQDNIKGSKYMYTKHTDISGEIVLIEKKFIKRERREDTSVKLDPLLDSHVDPAGFPAVLGVLVSNLPHGSLSSLHCFLVFHPVLHTRIPLKFGPLGSQSFVLGNLVRYPSLAII